MSGNSEKETGSDPIFIAEMLDWYESRTFDPEHFATGEINKILKKMK